MLNDGQRYELREVSSEILALSGRQSAIGTELRRLQLRVDEILLEDRAERKREPSVPPKARGTLLRPLSWRRD